MVLLINPLVSYLNGRLYKQKTELLEDRIEHISKLYLPILILIRNYYADREDYENAQKCKELMDNVLKTDEAFKKR